MIKETAICNDRILWIIHHMAQIGKDYTHTIHAVKVDDDCWIFPGTEFCGKEGEFITVSFENIIENKPTLGDEIYGEWSKCPKCNNDKVQKESNYCNKCGCKIKWVTIKWHEDI